MTNWKRKQCAVRAPLSACRVQMVTPKCCLGLTLWFQLDFTSKVNSCAFALGDLVLDTARKQHRKEYWCWFCTYSFYWYFFIFLWGHLLSPLICQRCPTSDQTTPGLKETSSLWTWALRRMTSSCDLYQRLPEPCPFQLWRGGPSSFLHLQGFQWVLPQSDGSGLILPSLFTPLIQLKLFSVCDCVIFATICKWVPILCSVFREIRKIKQLLCLHRA